MRENDFLRWIAAHTPPAASVPIHVGDDMAAVNLAATGTTALALLKIDQALDKVHFDLATHTPEQAGRKAVNRCLSDCAAMACLPAAILVAVALPRRTDEAFARALFHGCQSAAAAFDCPLVGGDTAVWDQRLAITIAALGRADGPIIQRNAAKPGDAICVSGKLGGSILGRHLSFTPRIALARYLAAHAEIHAMMDLSDGLAMDLPRLCAASHIGARIDQQKIPVHPDAVTLAQRDEISPVLHALNDGEDYELLFTLSEADWRNLKTAITDDPPLQGPNIDGIAITRIGTVVPDHQLRLIDHHGHENPWPPGGWQYQTT